ncbi:hypothetical protein QL285_076656 [Trifolium repens]|nr:hypothetical protein QL285_076656 [Trifolium repens]
MNENPNPSIMPFIFPIRYQYNTSEKNFVVPRKGKTTEEHFKVFDNKGFQFRSFGSRFRWRTYIACGRYHSSAEFTRFLLVYEFINKKIMKMNNLFEPVGETLWCED